MIKNKGCACKTKPRFIHNVHQNQTKLLASKKAHEPLFFHLLINFNHQFVIRNWSSKPALFSPFHNATIWGKYSVLSLSKENFKLAHHVWRTNMKQQGHNEHILVSHTTSQCRLNPIHSACTQMVDNYTHVNIWTKKKPSAKIKFWRNINVNGDISSSRVTKIIDWSPHKMSTMFAFEAATNIGQVHGFD